MKEIKNVTIMGMGYVGLTLGVILAEVGFNVYGVEINKEIIKSLNSGNPHFYEKGLKQMLMKLINKSLFVSDSVPDIEIDAFVISVGTPLLRDDKKADMSFIKNAIEEVGKNLKKGNLVVLRSTVPIGTCRQVVATSLEEVSSLRAGLDFHLAFVPERTIEGNALQELKELPQIIGGINNESVKMALNMFNKIAPTIVTVSSLEAAETIKILDNTYRDTRFAYANEIALICEKMGLNALEIITAANADYSRNSIPVPSPGVGGTCLSKDPYIFMDSARKKGQEAKLVKTAREINELIPIKIVERIRLKLKELEKDVKKAKIFIAGFAFKGEPETDDLRDSTTIFLLNEFKKYTDNIYGFDPVVSGEKLEDLGVKPTDFNRGCNKADAVLIMNNHKYFKDIDIVDLVKKVNKKCIYFDAWQMVRPQMFEDLKEDIIYMSVGY